MPERNHEVIIDSHVFPDTVTVTLANDEYVNSRDYVSKALYESVCDANEYWQEMNASLREAIADLWPRAAFTMHKENRESWVKLLRELGVEVDDG